MQRFGAGMVLAASLAPLCTPAQRATPARESGGRGTIVQFQEVRSPNIIYFEESGGMPSRPVPDKSPAREEASTKAPRVASTPTPAAADAPARRAVPRRVAAASDPRGERP